jgi:structure-specific recognition protein 1
LWLTTSSSAPGGAALYRFDGLRAGEFSRLEDFSRSYFKKPLPRRELSARGQTFGSLSITPTGTLDFIDLNGKSIAPLPLSSVASAALPGRGEVELQLTDEADAGDKEDEMLVELRFIVPADADLPGISTASGGAGASGGGDDERDAAVDLHKKLVDVAGLRAGGSEALVELPEAVGSFLVPRGRFAIEFFPTFLRLVGAAYEFKVQYKSIARISYLPLPSPTAESHLDATKFAIVISLDDPLRQGAQRHPHLVMQLESKQVDAALKIPAEDAAANRYEGLGAGGETILSGVAHKVVGNLFKKITGKPIVKPSIFESARKQRAIKANYKTSPGLLFPLDKSLMYIHKPTLSIRYQDVESVRLSSMSGASALKTFDCTVVIRATAGEPRREHVFTQIDKEEFNDLEKYFQDRKLSVIVDKAKVGAASDRDIDEIIAAEGGDDDDDDEDDEDASGGGEEEDDDDDDDDASGDDEDDGAAKKRKQPAPKKEKSKSSSKSSSKAPLPKKRAKKDYESD